MDDILKGYEMKIAWQETQSMEVTKFGVIWMN